MTYLVSLDIGNGFVKYLSIDRHGHYPSVYALEEPGISFEGLKSQESFVIGMDSSTYAVGPSAWRLGNIPVRTLDSSRLMGPDYRILFGSALVRACPLERSDIVVILSLPIEWYDRREQLRQHLAGEWQVSYRSLLHHYSLPEQNILLVPEGFGALCSVVLTDCGKVKDDGLIAARVGVCDIGTKTTDLIMFDRLEFVPARTRGYDVGLQEVYEIMARSATRLGYREFTFEELDAALTGEPLFNGAEDVSAAFTDWKHIALTQIANRIAGHIMTLWQGGREVQNILLAGGGAQHVYPYLLERFDHMIPMADGATANVIGAYHFAYGKLWGQYGH